MDEKEFEKATRPSWQSAGHDDRGHDVDSDMHHCLHVFGAGSERKLEVLFYLHAPYRLGFKDPTCNPDFGMASFSGQIVPHVA